MTSLAFASVAVTAVLGILCLVNTLYDFGPRRCYFRPRDWRLLDETRRTRTAIAPGRDYWSGVLGGLSVLMFAPLILLATICDIDWLKPGLAAIGVASAVIAYRCWFRTPVTSLQLAAAVMMEDWLP